MLNICSSGRVSWAMQAGMHCTRMCQVQANSIMKFNFKANSRRHQLDSQLDTNWVFPKPKYVQIDPTRCNYMEPEEWSFQATTINSLVQHSCLFSFLVFLLRMKSSSFHVRVFSFGRSFSASSALASVLHYDIVSLVVWWFTVTLCCTRVDRDIGEGPASLIAHRDIEEEP